jgi:hypothetical protein
MLKTQRVSEETQRCRVRAVSVFAEETWRIDPVFSEFAVT